VTVSGLGGDYKSLVAFVRTNTSGLRWRQMKPKGMDFVLTLQSEQDVHTMLGLNGKNHGGSRVMVKRGGTSNISSQNGMKSFGSRLPGGAVKQIEDYLKKQYQSEGGMLNLAGMAEANNMFNFNNRNFVNAIARILRDAKINVMSLNLANNGIETLEALQPLASVLQKSLANLSLANNRITGLEELRHLAVLKTSLKHLILDPNPGTNHMFPEIKIMAAKELFPTLERFNDTAAKDIIQFDLPDTVTRGTLPKAQGSFIDQKIAGVATKFLERYVEVFDHKNRELLDTFYFRERSCFSLVCRGAKFQDNSANSYGPRNRNLLGNLGAPALTERTQVGRSSILSTLKTLPQCRHDRGNFTVDIMQLPSNATSLQMIQVSLRGVFFENADTMRRMFHRVMLLAPMPNQNEMGVGITNDMLYLGELVKVSNFGNSP